MLIVGIVFVFTGKTIEAIILAIISVLIIPPKNTYDARIDNKNVIITKWFFKKTIPIEKTEIFLQYKNPDFPYLSHAAIKEKNDEYVIATNRLCWWWCVNEFLKEYINSGGKVNVFLENKKIPIKFKKNDNINENHILKVLLKNSKRS